MDAFELFVKLMIGLSWPTVCIVIVILFRKEISNRIYNLEAISGPGKFGATFIKNGVC